MEEYVRQKVDQIIERSKTSIRGANGSLMGQKEALSWHKKHADVCAHSIVTQEEYSWAMDQIGNAEPAEKLAERGNKMTAREFLESIGIEVSEHSLALLSEYFDVGYAFVEFPDSDVPDFDDPETFSDFECFVFLREEEE